MEGYIQIKTSRILVSSEGITEGGACAVDPGVQQDCWSQGRSHLVQVLTGLAGVSSRTCRLTAPQTDAEAATAWSNSWELSTLLCMILLIRSTTMSK